MHFSHMSTSIPAVPENGTRHISRPERKTAERNNVYFQARGEGHESPGENPFERVKNAKTRAFTRPHLTGYSPGKRGLDLERTTGRRPKVPHFTGYRKRRNELKHTASPRIYGDCNTITIYLRTCHQERSPRRTLTKND